MELISILIPIFNGEKYINRCLDSVKNQTYSNYEVIIFDDGSEDQSCKLIEKRNEQFNKLILIKSKHVGLSMARNELIKNAKGNFIFFLDVDDFMSKHIIEFLLKVQMMTNADLVQSSVQDTACFRIEDNINNHIQLDKIKVLNKYQALNSYSRTLEGPRCVPTGKLYKKEVFNGIIYPEGKIHEDVFTAHHIINNCKIYVILDQKLYYYYENEDSIIRQKFNLKKLDIIEAIKDSIDFFEQFDLVEEANWMRFRYCITIIHLYYNVNKYIPNQYNVSTMLINEFKKTLPIILRMNNVAMPLKNKLEKFPNSTIHEDFQDYWFYILNNQIK